jgi:tripartite-type tricarboxylate transporter receptor subunit TctC
MAMMRKSYVALIGLAFASAAIAGLSQAHAQEKIPYPVKVVKLITHSSPGGGSDVFLRDMAKFLKDIVNADFVVENVVGGSSGSAMAYMAKAPADGSAIYATTPTYIFTSHLSALTANYTHLEPIVNVFFDPQVIYTRTDAPFKTLKDVLDHAKSNRSAWGAASPGSLERISLEQLKRLTNTPRAAVVSTEGGGETMINVLNGTLDVAIGELQELRGQLEGKKVRPLAVITQERVSQLPDVPTAKESGVDMVVRKFRGLAGPKGLPDTVIKAWEQAIPRLLEQPEYKKMYEAANLVPAFMPHAEYAPFIAKFAEEQKSFLAEVGVIKKQ